MMRLMAAVLRVVAALLSVLPVKRRIAFLSRQSSKLSLDFKLLIEYLRAQHPDLEIVVCLSEPELTDKKAFILGTIKQLLVARTSKVVVADGYLPAVCIPRKRPGIQIVQLWHALGAVKKFGYQSIGTPAGRSAESSQVACMHKNYDYIIAGGPGPVEALSEAFGYSSSSVFPLGLPRVDYLVDQSPLSPRKEKMRDLERRYPFLCQPEKKIALYAPTLRKPVNDQRWLTMSIEDLAGAFDGDAWSFVVAAHPLNKDFDPSLLQRMPWVHAVEGAKTIDLLGFADCVITDYSAVAFEAGILGKDVFFYVPDVETYALSPGLNLNPLDLFPLQSSRCGEELVRMIERGDARAGGSGSGDAFSQLIEEYYGPVVDGGCTARIGTELMRMIDN